MSSKPITGEQQDIRLWNTDQRGWDRQDRAKIAAAISFFASLATCVITLSERAYTCTCVPCEQRDDTREALNFVAAGGSFLAAVSSCIAIWQSCKNTCCS